ncbi:hypothetical protein ATANTOWER_027510 [Ataeniobius toweri]|uniref:Uncharacterized protein n=1 Tax=Ataeniobius toweri TaxID=208326 RepID=A0ABU7A2U6_9TELE|nr:hypothetical protein [Ataeniobius toweri]
MFPDYSFGMLSTPFSRVSLGNKWNTEWNKQKQNILLSFVTHGFSSSWLLYLFFILLIALLLFTAYSCLYLASCLFPNTDPSSVFFVDINKICSLSFYLLFLQPLLFPLITTRLSLLHTITATQQSCLISQDRVSHQNRVLFL